MRIKVQGVTGETLAKRMLYLAWQACGGPVGMGFLQNNPTATEEDVWNRGEHDMISHRKSGRANADYLFGRMMKLYFEYGEDWVDDGDRGQRWRSDYQSFCHKYHNFEELTRAAAESLSATITIEQQTAV